MLPEIETENPHEDEDVQDELEVIEENLNDLADEIDDLDLPWNINTIEQRIGRLDRMGRNVKNL